MITVTVKPWFRFVMYFNWDFVCRFGWLFAFGFVCWFVCYCWFLVICLDFVVSIWFVIECVLYACFALGCFSRWKCWFSCVVYLCALVDCFCFVLSGFALTYWCDLLLLMFLSLMLVMFWIDLVIYVVIFWMKKFCSFGFWLCTGLVVNLLVFFCLGLILFYLFC